MDDELPSEMESKPSAGGVLRRNRRLSSSRYYPYATREKSARKEEIREEVIRLGVELSLCVVVSMFLLCDDIRTMLWFCFKCWRDQHRSPNPVLERLLRVMHFVYLRDIKPKKGAFKNHGNSAQWSLIKTTWEEFHDGIIVMDRLVTALRRKSKTYDDRLLLSAIVRFKQQVLKSLVDKLRSAKDVSEANGFARETIEAKIFDLWTSVFDEEAKEATETLQAIRNGVINDLFRPISGKPQHTEIRALPPHSTYVLGIEFAKQHLKEEVVQLGFELSLLVAESMVLLGDDIRSVLWFCFKLWRNATKNRDSESPVVGKLLCVMHYVYSQHIKPNKKGGRIYDKNDGNPVQWELIKTTLKDLSAGYRDLDSLFSLLRGEECCLVGLVLPYRMEEAVKKVDDKLSYAKELANGFAMESDIMDLWKSIFDKDTEEGWRVKVKMGGILSDLFSPLLEDTEKD